MITSKLEGLIQPLTYMNMDLTHIRMLYDILSLGAFHHVLEIGSFDGASAIAFISALNDNHIDRVTFCDTHFQPRFHRVVDEALYKSGVILREYSSLKVLGDEEFDFVLIDGDHSLQNVREEFKLLRKYKIKHLAAHDTNSSAVGIAACEGAAYLKQELFNDPEYQVIEDCQIRPNEKTNRGFMFATIDPELFSQVKTKVFKC